MMDAARTTARISDAYRVYCRVATALFLINTVYPVTTKLLQDRLAEDWFHSALHLGSGLLGAYAGWCASSLAPAKLYTWGIALGYLALGSYGWFTRGLFLGTPLAIPLGIADNVFHLLLSASAIPAITLATRRPSEAVRESRRP